MSETPHLKPDAIEERYRRDDAEFARLVDEAIRSPRVDPRADESEAAEVDEDRPLWEVSITFVSFASSAEGARDSIFGALDGFTTNHRDTIGWRLIGVVESDMQP